MNHFIDTLISASTIFLVMPVVVLATAIYGEWQLRRAR